MIGKLMARRQVDRFAILDCYVPGDQREGAIAELVLAMEAAEDEAVAIDVTNDWLREQREMPKPADLRRLIWEANEIRKPTPVMEETPPRGNCSKCRGYGILESIGCDSLESICSYCDCEEGRSLRIGAGQSKCFVDLVNEARRKLLKKFAKNPMQLIATQATANKRTGQTLKAEDVYEGDF